MKLVHKVAVVAAGYLLAFFLAMAAVGLHTAIAAESGAKASDGMSAFGDLVLFGAVFFTAALLPTGVGLFFLLSKKKGAEPIVGPDPCLGHASQGPGVAPSLAWFTSTLCTFSLP